LQPVHIVTFEIGITSLADTSVPTKTLAITEPTGTNIEFAHDAFIAPSG
jgi:hypothetical protein